MSKAQKYQMRALAFMVVALFLFILSLVISGCKVPQNVFVTAKDSTTTRTVITRRDTVVVIGADSARIKMIVGDVTELRKMLEALRTNPRISRGEKNATIIMSMHGDTLVATATCDSMAVELKNALTTIQELKERNVERTAVVEVKPSKDNWKIPGGLRGTIILIGVLVGAILAIKLIFKYI